MRPESEMVSSHSSGSSGDLDDVTSDHDVIFDSPSSRSNDAFLASSCPHCNFRAESPTQMTQHSWNVHPLLMRRKKHLITSRKNDDVSSRDVCESSSIHNDLDMQKCSLQSSSPKREVPIHNVMETDGDRSQSSHTSMMTNTEKSDLRTPVAMSTNSFSQNPAPHRHVAIVRPVPNEQQQQLTTKPAEYSASHVPEQRNLQQQPLNLLSQPGLQDQLVYAPMFNVLIPGLNQYVTIPIPVGGIPPNKYPGVFQQTVPTHQHNAYNANYAAHLQSQTLKHPTIPKGGNADFIDYETIRERLLGKPDVASPKVGEVKPFSHTSHQEKNSSASRNSKNTVADRQQTEQTYMPAKHENLCGDKGAFPSANVSSPPEPQKIEPMCEEKLQALENALRKTDCCGIEDKSTTMPFQCPDGVWRMVTFKCIRGVWLVNIPGSSTPTIYVPCNTTKKAKAVSPCPTTPQNVRKFQTGDKRRLSDPIFRSSLEVDAKRLCASAPNMSLQSTSPVQTTTTIKRTLSDPEISSKLPEPRQHFVSSEGQKMNISVVKRVPSASTSDSLIRSLLLRKPSPNNDVTMTSLKDQHTACMVATDRHISRQLGNINHSSMNNDAMAY